MTRPLVSIVVPTYNRAGYVETAITSLLEQDYPELEVIVIDDGSRDDTPAVLERIAERADPERFRWWRHDNAGQPETLNRGWAAAKGDLLGYLSSDDFLNPGAISRMVEAVEAHPEAEVYYPWFRVVDEADHTIDTVRPPLHTFIDSLRWGMCIAGAGTLVRRETLERVGGWNPENRTCPDMEWFLRARDAVFCVVPEPLSAWRFHAGSISVNTDMQLLREQLRMLDEIYADPDVSDAVLAVRAEAYAAALMSTAIAFEGPNIGAPGRRFAVQDRIGGLASAAGLRRQAGETLSLKSGLTAAEQQIAALSEIADELRRTADARDLAVHERDVRIAQLEQALRDRDVALRPSEPAPAGVTPEAERPAWLRAGRRLTPAPLRHRVGVAVHRLRRSSK